MSSPPTISRDDAVGAAPPPIIRLAAALVAGLMAVGLAALQAHYGDRPDVDQLWYAARALLSGENPYERFEAGGRALTSFPLMYPLTAVVAVVPVALLPLVPFRMVVMGIFGALFGYAISRTPVRLWALLSGSFLSALSIGQLSPFFTAAIVLPWLGAFASLKPNLGLVVAASVRDRRGIIAVVAGSLALGVISLVVLPRWPLDWLAAVRSWPGFAGPISRPLGWLVLLALLRWRRPEARMMIALACVPQTGLIYETLPLFLIPRRYGEALALTLSSIVALWWQLGFRAYDEVQPYPDHLAALVDHSQPIFVALLYLPCLVMILRRPNEGWVPAWIERLLARVAWRGADVTSRASRM